VWVEGFRDEVGLARRYVNANGKMAMGCGVFFRRACLRYMLGRRLQRITLPCAADYGCWRRRCFCGTGRGCRTRKTPCSLRTGCAATCPSGTLKRRTDGFGGPFHPLVCGCTYFGRAPMAEPCTRDPAGTSSGGSCWSATPTSSASACCRPSWRMWMDRVGLRPGPSHDDGALMMLHMKGDDACGVRALRGDVGGARRHLHHVHGGYAVRCGAMR
jgi:hypothetical protein